MTRKVKEKAIKPEKALCLTFIDIRPAFSEIPREH